MNSESLHFQPKNYKNLELATLVIMAQNDDLKALEEIIKRVQNNVYVTLCYLEDKVIEPLDLTQEVLIKMASNIKKGLKEFIYQYIPNKEELTKNAENRCICMSLRHQYCRYG